ncbi:MAG: chorismate lyase, partial [Thiobacillus sp.]|nr:chorismate lyase [Thiobacillus sp.]
PISLAFRRLDQRHPLYRASLPYLASPTRALWARRSQFALAGRRLMVTEVFLPTVLQK